MNMTPRIVVVGSLNMDLVTRTPRIPMPGETIIGHEFFTAPGGKGANQAVAAARLGGHVTMIGRVGQDDFGKAMRQTLTRDGVDCTYVFSDEKARTGIASILVDDAGQNSIVVAPGANARLDPDDIDRAQQAIASADVLLLQLEIPLETVIHAAEVARANGVTVVLNPAPARSDLESLLPLVDFIIPNESETALLTGLSVETEEEAIAATHALRKQGVDRIILTLGARGALLAQPENAQRIPAFPIQPVDTTAAGDAFVGGFAVALAEKRPLPEAVRWGNAAGGLAATRLGAQPSLPTRQEVLDMLASQGESQ